MRLTLQQHGAVYLLPDALAARFNVMVVDRWLHLANKKGGYYDAPLCGASTASRNVTRRRDFADPVIPMCRDCAHRAGVKGA